MTVVIPLSWKDQLLQDDVKLLRSRSQLSFGQKSTQTQQFGLRDTHPVYYRHTEQGAGNVWAPTGLHKFRLGSTLPTSITRPRNASDHDVIKRASKQEEVLLSTLFRQATTVTRRERSEVWMATPAKRLIADVNGRCSGQVTSCNRHDVDSDDRRRWQLPAGTRREQLEDHLKIKQTELLPSLEAFGDSQTSDPMFNRDTRSVADTNRQYETLLPVCKMPSAENQSIANDIQVVDNENKTETTFLAYCRHRRRRSKELEGNDQPSTDTAPSAHGSVVGQSQAAIMSLLLKYRTEQHKQQQHRLHVCNLHNRTFDKDVNTSNNRSFQPDIKTENRNTSGSALPDAAPPNNVLRQQLQQLLMEKQRSVAAAAASTAVERDAGNVEREVVPKKVPAKSGKQRRQRSDQPLSSTSSDSSLSSSDAERSAAIVNVSSMVVTSPLYKRQTVNNTTASVDNVANRRFIRPCRASHRQPCNVITHRHRRHATNGVIITPPPSPNAVDQKWLRLACSDTTRDIIYTPPPSPNAVGEEWLSVAPRRKSEENLETNRTNLDVCCCRLSISLPACTVDPFPD